MCCERCFQDRVLVHKIREEGTNGSCPWCGASDVKVLPVAELGDLFRDLARNYAVAEDDRGEWIDQLFQEDWELFADDKYVSVRRHDLTLAILESGLDPKDDVMDYPAYEDQFVRLQTSPVDLLGQWENRVAEMFEHTDTDAGPTPLESGSAEMLDYIADAVGEVGAAYPQNRPLYRARTHDQRGRRERFSLAEMGAPPPDVTLGGRANRAREPVLYMASDPHTALAEKRAWKGAVVAIATMKLISPVRILDLVSKPRRIRSPFDYGEHLTWLFEARALLREFGRELSRPVIPGEEERHYVPSQRACDAVRLAGFHGIAYPSAMGAGRNIVLFDPSGAEAIEVEYHKVTRTRVRSEVIEREEIQIDDYPYD